MPGTPPGIFFLPTVAGGACRGAIYLEEGRGGAPPVLREVQSMADHPGSGATPTDAMLLARLAEGFFPSHAPRPAAAPHSPAVVSAIARSCALGAEADRLARLAQPPAEPAPARIGPRAASAAGLPAILSTFRVVLPRMGVRDSLAALLRVNQKTGFDCQSCAWPSPDGRRHRFEFCENGAKAIASEGTDRRITAEFFSRWSVDDLAGQSDAWLEQQGRLAEPLIRRPGADHYQPIGWDEAFQLIAGELNGLRTPDGAAFYTSGRASNEAAFLYQLFARDFGTNNLPDCSNMCHESSGTALAESLGIGKGTVTLEDFEQTDLILLVGQNPGTNHPRMLTSLEHARRNGATIIAVNPLPETGLLRFTDPNPDEYATPLHFAAAVLGSGRTLADLHLPVRVNGDIALLKGLMKVMLAEEAAHGGVLDHRFIGEFTEGFDRLRADLEATTWPEIEAGSGLTRDDIERAGRIVAGSRRMICCWAMGLTQHRDAVSTIQTLVNLLLLGGHIGRPGTGTCCVRGHSNVQGDRTMGIWERPSAGFLDALAREFGIVPPRHAGKDVVDTITAMHDGEVEVFVGLGGNFLAAAPDTVCTAEALRSCRLTVQIATKLNRGHLVTGRTALLLPCLGRMERDPAGILTVEDSMGIISPSRGHTEAAAPALRSETAIIAGIAHATLGARSRIDYPGLSADYGRIRDHIARVVPGFADFNIRLARGPFYLPNPARQRRFVTPSGRAGFHVAPIARHPLNGERYLLATIRSHDQFNTTVYGLDDRYRGVHGGRRVLFANPDDLAARGWTAGTRVDITSHFGDERRVARSFQLVPYPIPRGCVAAYFPEANVLVPIGSVAERSNTPTSKSIVVSLAAVPA
jgi:molybdopterin-dependent oxidoreductase alpha subunit